MVRFYGFLPLVMCSRGEGQVRAQPHLLSRIDKHFPCLMLGGAGDPSDPFYNALFFNIVLPHCKSGALCI